MFKLVDAAAAVDAAQLDRELRALGPLLGADAISAAGVARARRAAKARLARA